MAQKILCNRAENISVKDGSQLVNKQYISLFGKDL